MKVSRETLLIMVSAKCTKFKIGIGILSQGSQMSQKNISGSYDPRLVSDFSELLKCRINENQNERNQIYLWKSYLNIPGVKTDI